MRLKGRNHLTLEDRKIIETGLEKNLTYFEIGLMINRTKSLIRRECNRFDDYKLCTAEKAQKDFLSKQKLAGIKRGSAQYLKIKEIEKLA